MHDRMLELKRSHDRTPVNLGKFPAQLLLRICRWGWIVSRSVFAWSKVLIKWVQSCEHWSRMLSVTSQRESVRCTFKLQQ